MRDEGRPGRPPGTALSALDPSTVRPTGIEPGTRTAAICGTGESIELFFCNFGLNGAYRPALEAAGVCFSGLDAGAEPRILELPDHRFFLATLYVPQASSRKAHPHPVLSAFVEAAAATATSAQVPAHLRCEQLRFPVSDASTHPHTTNTTPVVP